MFQIILNFKSLLEAICQSFMTLLYEILTGAYDKYYDYCATTVSDLYHCN